LPFAKRFFSMFLIITYFCTKLRTMLVANISQFRKDLKFYIDSVTDNHDTLIVNGNGKTVVVMSLDDYNATIETQYLLSTEANRNMMKKSMEQLKDGKVISKTIEELESTVNAND
jgi:antitoxin YefM